MRILAVFLTLTLAACGADGLPKHPKAPASVPFPIEPGTEPSRINL